MVDETCTKDTWATGPIGAFELGVAPYVPLQDLQRRLRLAVAEGTLPGALLLLEHYPVIPLGPRGAISDLRDPVRVRERGVPVVRSERGGQATLHAPGQLVSYPIIRIPHHDLRRYVRDLEETLILVLEANDLYPQRRTARPGLYLSGQKIASVGLRCHRWVASHGPSLNVHPD